ncbi:unnamed protein product [Prorocentrum cordatum]|uniref:Exocyst complex component Sec6 n=1 Tax=Prorocentrum cordatum TaxID=2364126 RepID=A0ABN9U0T6_9DINO|nr:unnamed protein product [Polarella glacialis]
MPDASIVDVGTVDQRKDALVSIAHSLLGRDALGFDRDELHSVVMLAAAREKLVRDGMWLDTHSENGRKGCARFLKKVEKAASALSVDPAPREYRSKFTADFRSMFPGYERNYRVDFLVAALSLRHAVWLNGEAYHFDEAVVAHAEALREAVLDLVQLLDQWASPDRPPGRARTELCARLRRLDAAWAGFEEAYVEGLSAAQQRARGALDRAVQQDRRLRSAESVFSADTSAEAMDELRQEEEALLEHLGYLSAAAGNPRPSTQVLECSMQILDEAVQVLAISRHEQGTPVPTVVLAARAVESYNGLRDYLVGVREHLADVHPQLGKNAGLAERLARWEDSWERFAHYMESSDLMEGVRLLASFLAGALEAVPSLQPMLEDRDAELFLVLPRLVCLCLLSDPDAVARLLRPLLPVRLAEGPEEGGGQVLAAASAQLERVLELLGGPERGAWEALASRAVAGGGAAQVGPSQQEAAAAAVEALMREIEGWSMELQRHHPAAWNDLSDLLVQCMVWRPGDAASGDAEGAIPARFVL